MKKFFHRILVRLGLRKQVLHDRDKKLAEVINKIVCSPYVDGAYIVAVETKQAILQILSYMETNRIKAVGVTDQDLGKFHRLSMKAAVTCMDVRPTMYQVYVMNRYFAYSGWQVPKQLELHWGKVTLLHTFEASEPWRTQFESRLRRTQ